MSKRQGRPPNVKELDRLRTQIQEAASGPIEITQPAPIEIEAAEYGRTVATPPPGGWPEDAGWREEAEQRQGIMGEDPQ